MTQNRPIDDVMQRSLGRYVTYAEAQRVVDSLSDQGFPVHRITIVGCDLRLIEQVVGRMTLPRAALAGALTGAWFGFLIGIIFWIVSPWTGAPLISATLLGLAFGAIFGAIAHAATRGRRDFASLSRLEPMSYEVFVEDAMAAEAQRLLGVTPAYPEGSTATDETAQEQQTRSRH